MSALLVSLREERGAKVKQYDGLRGKYGDKKTGEWESSDRSLLTELHENITDLDTQIYLEEASERQRKLVADSTTHRGSSSQSVEDALNTERGRFMRLMLSKDSAEYARNAELLRRDMQVDIPDLGGYVALPQVVMDEILEQARREFIVRRISRNVGRVARAGVGVRELTDRPSFQMGTELTTPSPTDLKFGKRTLAPKDYVGEVKVSRALLEEWTQGDSYIREQMTYGAGYLQEDKFFNGNGSTEPLGLLTAAEEGLPSNRNLTSSTTGAIKANDLIDMVLGNSTVAMRPAYYNDPSFAIILSAHAFSEARKFTDSNGQYVFTPVPYIGNSLEAGVSYTMLGKPVYVSEFLSNVAAGNTCAIAGAFRHYHIVDGLSTELQYLQELYARENKNGYIMRGSFDAAPFKNDSHTRLVVKS